MAKALKSKIHGWTALYFFMSIALFALLMSLAVHEIVKGPIEDGTIEACLLVSILFAVSTIPFFTILYGKKTPRNWKRLLGWIIVESIYNPVFGIPIWVAWAKKSNKARYGDEAAFRQEAIEAQARKEAANERYRKIGTNLVMFSAATQAYEKMSPEQR